MKNSYTKTSIGDNTSFYILINENLGWIEPVFLLISPNLKDVLRLTNQPSSLIKISSFEIVEEGYHYIPKFYNSGSIIKDYSPELKIERAYYQSKIVQDKKTYSIFESSHYFTEISNYLEYCFFYIADGISYLTSFTSFEVDDYL